MFFEDYKKLVQIHYEFDSVKIDANASQNYILILDSDDIIISEVFLQAVDFGWIPILIPKTWDKDKIDNVFELYPHAHTWKLGLFKKGNSDGRIPDEIQGTYGCFSSGSTGIPKLFFLSVEGALKNAKAHAASLGISRNTTIIKVLPIEHSFGLVAYIWTPLVVGCSVEYFHIFEGWRTLSQFGSNSIVHLTPVWVRLLLRSKSEHVNFYGIISIGAGSCTEDEMIQLEKLANTKIYITYGLTEAGPRVSTGVWPPVNRHKNYYYVGKAISGTETKVLTDKQTIKDQGEGFLLVRRVDSKDRTGSYLITTDFVFLNDQQEIFLKPRSGNLFFFNNEAINLLEISDRNTLEMIAFVSDNEWFLVVFGVENRTLSKSILEKIPQCASPAKVVWIESAPLTTLGKLDSQALLKQLGIPDSVSIFRSSI